MEGGDSCEPACDSAQEAAREMQMVHADQCGVESPGEGAERAPESRVCSGVGTTGVLLSHQGHLVRSGHIFGPSLFSGGGDDAVNIDVSTSNCSSLVAQEDLITELSSSNITNAKMKTLLYALGEYLSLSK